MYIALYTIICVAFIRGDWVDFKNPNVYMLSKGSSKVNNKEQCRPILYLLKTPESRRSNSTKVTLESNILPFCTCWKHQKTKVSRYFGGYKIGGRCFLESLLLTLDWCLTIGDATLELSLSNSKQFHSLFYHLHERRNVKVPKWVKLLKKV